MENGGQSVARLEAEDVFDEAPLGISAGIKGLLFVMKLPQIAIQQISQHKSPSTQVVGTSQISQACLLIKASSKSGP